MPLAYECTPWLIALAKPANYRCTFNNVRFLLVSRRRNEYRLGVMRFGNAWIKIKELSAGSYSVVQPNLCRSGLQWLRIDRCFAWWFVSSAVITVGCLLLLSGMSQIFCIHM